MKKFGVPQTVVGGTDHWRHPFIILFSSAPRSSTVSLHQRHNKTLCAVDKGYVMSVMSLSKSTTQLAVSKHHYCTV
jgi:hypothetical protein